MKNKGKTSLSPQGNRAGFLALVRRFGGPVFLPVLFVALAAGGILKPSAAQAQKGQSAKVSSKPVSTPRPTASSKSAPGRKSTSGLGPTLAATRFDLVGVDVTVDPAAQTVPINTPTEIRTLIAAPTGVDPEAYLATINPNYRIRGELSGPAYANPVQMEARIGDSFPIPGFGLKGDYVLQNLRVVDAGVQGAPTVAAVTPDACVISVIDQILVTNVQVRELTYDEIVRSGIQVTDSSYQFFNFTLALGTESNGVSVQIPVAFPPNSPGIPPTPIVGTPSIPNDLVALPDVQPVMLDIQGGGGDGDPDYWIPDDAGLGGGSNGGNIKVPGLVVFPGRVGFLNQFFEAIVIVANGSPAGSNLVVRTLTARVKLPTDGSLRVPPVQGLGIVTEKSVMGFGADNQPGTPDDENFLAAGKSGQAKFLIEGLTEGLHTVDFDLQGTLTGLTNGRTAQISGTARGAVLVRDRTFATTFTHPGVVRAGQDYDLAMTVLNTGQANINGAFAALPPNSISGATLLPGDTGRRDFPTTILPGQSGTIKWRLRAGVTGQVTAAYVKIGNGLSAGLTLVTGVGDRNIPLSPDSLILPDNACYLPPDVLDAARATLGQAWSVATTPRNALPDGVTPISKATVIRRAVDVGIAGLRVQFGESLDVSLATLSRDWVGVDDETVSPGFAEVLQKTISGFAWNDGLGGYYRRRLLGLTTPPTTPACGNAGSPAVGLGDLHRNLIEAESPRDGFLSAFVIQPDGSTLVRSGWTDPAGKTTGFGSGTSRTGDIPQAGVSDLREVDFTRATETLPTSGGMLWATNPAPGVWSLDLYGVATGSAEVSVAVPFQGGRKYNRYSANVPVSAGSRHRIVLRPFSTDIPRLEVFQNGSFAPVGPLAFSGMVSEPSPSVTEVRQVTNQVLEGGDDYGRLVGVLFNKPMSESSLTLTTAAAAQSRFRIGGGELVSNPNERVVGAVSATGSIPNYGKRFVFIKLDGPVGPFVNRTLSITGATDAGFQTLSLAAPIPIRMTVSPQGQPAGGFATGRVLNGDGSPVVGARVSCFKPSELCQYLINGEILGIAVTDADGRFSFDYVRNNNCSNGPVFSSIHPTTRAEKGNSNFVAFHGQNLTPDLVFLARGRVQGTIVNQNGSPSPRAFVQVTPTLDQTATKVVQADETGAFQVNDLPVGSLAVKAQAVVGNAPRPFGYAAGFIDGPNATATVRLVLRENSGTARGEVREANGVLSKGRLVVASRPGLSGPVGEIVGYAYTDNQGRFSIPGLPLEQLNVSTPDPAVNDIFSPVDWRSFTVTPLNPIASGLVLTLPGYGDVSGFLRDDAGNGIAGIVRCAGRGVRTNADGSFLIRAVPQGTHDIEGTENATFFKASGRIQVTANQPTSNVILTIRRPLAPGVIEGYVRKMVNGVEVPASGVVVTYDGLHPYTFSEDDLQLPPPLRNPIPTRTDGAGYYRLEGVPSGAGFTVRYFGNQAGHYANLDVEVAPNQTVTRNVVFNPAKLKLRIHQDDGTPVVGTVKYSIPGLLSAEYRKASYGVIDPDPLANGKGFLESLSNPDGTLEITMIPGLYRLGAYNTFGTASGITGTLAPGETLEHDFYLVSNLNPSGSLRGTVYRPDGVTPVGAGVRVLIGLQDVRTDGEGKYLFPIIADRSGTLTANDPLTGQTNQIRVVTNPTGEVVQDIRLLGYGDVRVRVVDGAGQPVPNAVVNVTGGQYPNAQRRTQLFPVDGGQTLLSNLFEGDYSIEATADLVSGRTAVTIVRGQTTEVTIKVAETGTVVGKVWLPGRTAGSGLADVSLYSSGRLIGFMTSSSNADTYGDFRFVGVPKGPFEVRVFDNRTGRVGTANGTILEQNVDVRADVDLNSVGKVTGQVRSNGLPYSGITVEIQSPNATNFKPVRATTDAEGRFSFPGVPSGRFQVQTLDGPNGFNGITTGDVPTGVEPLPDTVADISMRPSAKLQGTIFSPDGVTPVVGARVTVTVDGFRFNVASDEQGRYLTEWAPLGQGAVYAESPLGFDRGYSDAFTLSTSGATETRNVTLRGVGAISGVAFNNDGQRLNQGTVSYTSTSEGNQVRLTATVQPDGTFSFAGVPAGGYSLTLAVTGRTGVGAFNGTLASGETATVNLTLSDAGSVVGRTLGGPNGATGTPNTKITLRVTTGPLVGTTFVTYTNSSGRFGFAAVPLGNFVLRAENFALQAAADGGGILAANEQILDVGDLSLDGTPISVASVNPAGGALAQRDADVVVTFSEPANSATVNGNTVRVLNGTTPVAGSVTLSADKLSATFHPTTRFANAGNFTLLVTTDLTDLVGNRMARNFESTFTTVDDLPPVLLAVDPPNGSPNLPLTYLFTATFDEPLNPTQDPGAISIRSIGGQLVNGTISIVTLSDGKGQLRLDVIDPVNGLQPSTNYILTVQGVRDVAGNVQATPSVTRFSSSDFTKPVIGPIAVNGNEIVDNPTITIPPTPIFTAELTDDASGINLDSMTATLDGAPITGFTLTAQGPEPNPAYRFGWNPPTLADGQHTLVLTVKDRANNLSLIRSATFTTVADPLPVVTLVNPAENAELIQGQRLTLRATATDNTSVAEVKFSVNGTEVGRVTNSPYEIPYRIPVDAVSLTFEATATDSVGQTATVTRTLPVIADPGTTVTGRVLDAQGNPVQGATATAQGKTATTDADGRFSIANVSTVDGDFYVLTRAGQGRARIFGDSLAVSPVLRGTSDSGTIIATVPTLDQTAGQELTENETDVALPFPVRIGGNDYQSMLVGRNGRISFNNGQPTQVFPEGRPTFLVSDGGGFSVTVDANSSRVVVSWRDGSPENSIQFQAVLFASGRVQYGYGALFGSGPIGYSPGQNPTLRTIDWRINAEGTIAPNEAVSETFGVFDLGSSFITMHPGVTGGYGVFAQYSTIDRSGPVVVGVTPAADARDVSVSSPIVVSFNEPVRAIDGDPNFTAYVTLYQVDPTNPSNATQVAVTSQLNADRTELTVTPSQLVTGWHYSLNLLQVSDDAGNLGGYLSNYRFRTVNLAPTISISSPGEGNSVVEGQSLTVIGTVADDAPLRANPNGAVSLRANGNFIPVTFTGGVSGTWSASLTVPYGVTQLSLRADVTDGDLSAFATRELTVTPDPLTTVSGRVVDANGQPVEGAQVRIPERNRSTVSAADGTFTFTQVTTSQGNLTVTATRVIGGNTAFGSSASTAPVAGGVTVVGDIVLADRPGFENELGAQVTLVNGSAQVNLPFTFNYYGQPQTSVFVNQNGSLTFNQAEGNDTANYYFGYQPSISPFRSNQFGTWDSADFGIFVNTDQAGRAVFTWWDSRFPNNLKRYQAMLFADGRIRYAYRQMPTSVDAAVGLTPGSNLTGDPVHFLSSPTLTIPANRAIREVFNSGQTFNLGSTVITFTPNGTGYEGTVTANPQDETGPFVTSVSPTGGQREVALNTTISAAFNEPLDPAQDFGQVMTVNGSGIGVVQGSYALDQSGRTLTFTPDQPLPSDTTFNVIVSHQRDLTGNLQTVTRFWSFTTVDQTGPNFTILYNYQQADGLETPFASATFSAAPLDTLSDIDPSTLQAMLDGVDVTNQTAIYAYGRSASVSFTPDAPLADGQHIFTLSIADVRGNLSTRTATLTVSSQPRIDSVSPSSGTELGGTQIVISGYGLFDANGTYATAPSVFIGGIPTTNVQLAGLGGVYATVPPSSVLGPVAVTVVTNHGSAELADGFTYTPSPQMPFQPENDTVLLWHLDGDIANCNDGCSAYNPGGLDAGLLGINVDYSRSEFGQNSGKVTGRFGDGWRDSRLTAVEDFGALSFGNGDFTGEVWVKLDPNQSRSSDFPLLRKGDGATTEFELYLTPAGDLTGRVHDVNGVVAEVTSAPGGGGGSQSSANKRRAVKAAAALSTPDNGWHAVAFVLDRSGNSLALYRDGQNLASVQLPAGFGAIRATTGRFEAGRAFGSDNVDLDEIRLSSRAHSDSEIANAWDGTALGIQAVRITPNTLTRGTTTQARVLGYNLKDATARLVDEQGNDWADASLTVDQSSKTSVSLTVTVANTANVGRARIELTANGQVTTIPCDITATNPSAVTPETALLWRLDSFTGNPLRTPDEGANQYTAFTSGLINAPGRFGGGFDLNYFAPRSLVGDGPSANFTFGANGFSAQGWVRGESGIIYTGDGPVSFPNPRAATIAVIGREDAAGQNSDFTLTVSPRGQVRAQVADEAGLVWETATIPAASRLNDGEWHLVTLVADRGGDRLSIFIDGVERAAAPMPSGFGTFRKTGNVFRAATRDLDGPTAESGDSPRQQGGLILDEIRVLDTPLSAQAIRDQWFGVSGAVTSSRTIAPFLKLKNESWAKYSPLQRQRRDSGELRIENGDFLKSRPQASTK